MQSLVDSVFMPATAWRTQHWASQTVNDGQSRRAFS
jgi:CheY-like chemotaxis protein